MSRSCPAPIAFTLIVLCAHVAGAAIEVHDDRLTLRALGPCTAAAPASVAFGGKRVTISGSSLKSATGQVTYTAPAPILDAANVGPQVVLLTGEGVIVIDGKKSRHYAIAGTAMAGRLLAVYPDRLLFYVVIGERTLFVTQSARAQRVFYSVGSDFVGARTDAAGNTIIATRSSVIVITRFNQRLALLELGDDARIDGVELDPTTSSGILLTTMHGLLKISPDGRVHSLLSESGRLTIAGGQPVWCDAATNTASDLQGLDAIGRLENDKAYARLLLTKAQKYLQLGVDDRAFDALARLVELIPENDEARRLMSTLASRLLERSTGSNGPKQ